MACILRINCTCDIITFSFPYTLLSIARVHGWLKFVWTIDFRKSNDADATSLTSSRYTCHWVWILKLVKWIDPSLGSLLFSKMLSRIISSSVKTPLFVASAQVRPVPLTTSQRNYPYRKETLWNDICNRSIRNHQKNYPFPHILCTRDDEIIIRVPYNRNYQNTVPCDLVYDKPFRIVIPIEQVNLISI